MNIKMGSSKSYCLDLSSWFFFVFPDAAATVVEILTEFEGNNNAQYVLTAAIAKSPVDKNSKFLFFYHASPAQSSKFEVSIKQIYRTTLI